MTLFHGLGKYRNRVPEQRKRNERISNYQRELVEHRLLVSFYKKNGNNSKKVAEENYCRHLERKIERNNF